MIVAKLNHDDEPGEEGIMFILEPGNIAKLQLGQPIRKLVNDFLPDLPYKVEVILCYTPDIVWVGEQLTAGKDLGETMMWSISRPEVYSRELDPEALQSAEIRPKKGT